MRAGQLRHRIVIQQLAEGRDSAGGIAETWITFVTLPAAVEPLKGREYFQSDQLNAEVSHRIKVRYYPGILPKMRVSWGTRIFRVEAVLNIDERNREIQLMCTEVI